MHESFVESKSFGDLDKNDWRDFMNVVSCGIDEHAFDAKHRISVLRLRGKRQNIICVEAVIWELWGDRRDISIKV